MALGDQSCAFNNYLVTHLTRAASRASNLWLLGACMQFAIVCLVLFAIWFVVEVREEYAKERLAKSGLPQRPPSGLSQIINDPRTIHRLCSSILANKFS